MFTFIISVVLASFACWCFFKKSFWENRYLVISISGCVALIATLIVNFSVRGSLQTKVKTLWSNPLYTFYFPDSLLKGSPKVPIILHWDYYYKHKAKEFYKNSTKKQIPLKLLLYSMGKKGNTMCVGTFKNNVEQDYLIVDKDVYITKSPADSIAYVCRKKLYYDVKPNNWITGFSLPRISTITVFCIPPKEFATIPDSLIHKAPF